MRGHLIDHNELTTILPASYGYSLLVDCKGAQLDSDVFGKDTAQFDSARQ